MKSGSDQRWARLTVVSVGAQLITLAGSSAIGVVRRACGGTDGPRPRDRVAVPKAGLVDLVYELLDAHRDTADLALAPWDDEAWQAHLEYLRSLQRKSRELLACSSVEHRSSPDSPDSPGLPGSPGRTEGAR